MSQPTPPNPAQVPPFDGTTGNVISRAEPKVRAASLTAVLSPVVLYEVYRYVPGISSLPHELDAIVGALIVGALTFAAGFAAKAVNRVDLFAQGEAAKLEGEVNPVLVRTFGQHAVDDVEGWVHKIHDEVLPPLEQAAHAAVQAIDGAVTAGVDPVTAVKAELPSLVQAGQTALDTAVADGRAELPALAVEAVTGAAEAHPALVQQVAPVLGQAVTAVGGNAELADMLRHVLALIEQGSPTPIADAVQASLPTAQATLPPVPAAPATVELAAVTPEAPPA